MSTKLSRSDQFYEAFEAFIAPAFVLSGKLDVWDLILQTENTKRQIHKYILCFPYNRMVYTIDREVILADGTKHGPGAIYEPQTRPTMDEFRQEFCAYFSQFEMKSHTGESLSGVYFHSSKTNDKRDMVMEIMVRYHKKYQPYPIKATREQELEYHMRQLEARATEAERNAAEWEEQADGLYYDLEDTKLLFQQYREQQAEKFNKLTAAFYRLALDAFLSKEDPQDCPVCLDPMTKDSVHITLCGHYLCQSCNSKCTKCPICREDYD
jgi:hypothetical protein